MFYPLPHPKDVYNNQRIARSIVAVLPAFINFLDWSLPMIIPVSNEKSTVILLKDGNMAQSRHLENRI